MRRIRELTRAIDAREGELAAGLAQGLLAERGCGALTAAKLIGEIAGIERFPTDAKLARTAAAAPVPASSGRTDRHRLDRGGNRQLNCALHRLAVSKARLDAATAAYLARKQADGKTAARRCAASSATSPAASGDSGRRPRHRSPRRPSRQSPSAAPRRTRTSR